MADRAALAADRPARVALGPPLLLGRIIAVLRADTADLYEAVADVLVDAGITAVELTLTTTGTVEALPHLVERFAGRAEIGLGTVLAADAAQHAVDGGAAFLVTPTVHPEVVEVGRRRGRPVIGGALTPTEIEATWAAGASAVKVFPASVVGPAYLRAVTGPLPGTALVPSGGIPIEDIPRWLAGGAAAVSLGGELIGDALRGGSLNQLSERARRCRDLADQVTRRRDR